jgi:hypothetical protein
VEAREKVRERGATSNDHGSAASHFLSLSAAVAVCLFRNQVEEGDAFPSPLHHQ